MNELTTEWIAKTEGDYATAEGASFPKTRSLIELLKIALPIDESLELQRELLVQLERYAVRYRYPGESADKDEARAALRAAKVVRSFVRQRLGLRQ